MTIDAVTVSEAEGAIALRCIIATTARDVLRASER